MPFEIFTDLRHLPVEEEVKVRKILVQTNYGYAFLPSFIS